MRLARLLTHTAALSVLLLPSLAQGQNEGILRITCTLDDDIFKNGIIFVDGKSDPNWKCPKADIFIKSGKHKISVVYQINNPSDVKQYNWSGDITISPTTPLRLQAKLSPVYSEEYLRRQSNMKQAKSLENFINLSSVSLIGHKDEVWHADFSSDDKRVVTASRDYTSRVWGLEGAQIGELGGHSIFVDLRDLLKITP